MATVRATRGGVGFPTQAAGWSGAQQRVWGTYEVGVTPAAADIIIMCKLPKGAMIIGGAVKGDKLESAGSGSGLASVNIGLDAAVVTPDGTTVTAASTSNCLLAALVLGPDTAAVTGYKPEAAVRNVPLGGLLLTHGPLRTTVEPTNVTVTFTASILALTTGTLMVEVDYYMAEHA